MSLVYLYDGSFDGLLTAIFEGYSHKQHPDQVAEEHGLQTGFGQQIVPIATSETKARRVETGIQKKLGPDAHKRIWTAYLSGDPEKSTAIYNYIRRGFEIGRMVINDLAHPDVRALDKVYSLVSRETYLTMEFLRFSQMENGVFYAKITPDHNIVPKLMPHFVERYCVQPFLIHDKTHEVAGLYDLKEWYMVDTHSLTLPEESYDELQFKRMWKQFYETIAIRERFNPRCQRGHSPKKYWQNMTEHSFIETPKTRAADLRWGSAPNPAGALPRPAGALPRPAGALPRPAGALPRPAGALPQTPPRGMIPLGTPTDKH